MIDFTSENYNPVRNISDERALETCYFDIKAGERVCTFIESWCTQSKGRWANQKIQLLPWQRDFIYRIYGWKLKATGKRRIKKVLLEVPKKQGKTTLCSALSLYMTVADGESGAECYCSACNREQSRILFDSAAFMVRSCPDLLTRCAIVDSRHRILYPKNSSILRCNSSDTPSLDGLHAHCIICDEIHRLKDSKLFDIYQYASSAREQPLWICITTAGSSCEGVWWEWHEKAEKVSAGLIDDPTFLGVIYKAEPEDDIESPDTWKKANPSMGYTISEDDFKLELQQAKQSPHKLASFKRLRLNLVSNVDEVFIDPTQWKACGPADPPAHFNGLLAGPDQIQDRPCFIGVDLSKVSDLTAVSAIWARDPEDDSDEISYDLRVQCFLPKDRIDELAQQDNVSYRSWVQQGWLILTPGSVVDYGFIRKLINDMASTFDVRKILFDPWSATQLAIDLRETDGLQQVEFLRQGFLSLSPPTKHLECLILSRHLFHDGNPILLWNILNAIADQDPAGNVKLSKKKSTKKIDALAATINAIAGVIASPSHTRDSSRSVYESRGILVI